MGGVHMLGARGDNQTVDAVTKPLLGIDHLEFRVIQLDHVDEGREHEPHAGFPRGDGAVGLHIAEGTDVGIERHQLLLHLGQHVGVRFVHALSHGFERDAAQHTGILQHGYAVDQRLVPQILISGDLKGHTFGIIDDQRAARHVGNHVFVVRVIGLREEGGVKVAVVGQLALVQLLNQPLLAQNVQRVVAGDNQVIIRSAALGHLEQHAVNGVHGGPDHIDAGFFLKGGEGVAVHVALPAENVEHFFLLREGEGWNDHQRTKHESNQFFHYAISPFRGLVPD